MKGEWPNYYDVLGIECSASVLEIEEAYRRAKQSPSEDANLVDDAYLCLTDPYTRRLHDSTVGVSQPSHPVDQTVAPADHQGIPGWMHHFSPDERQRLQQRAVTIRQYEEKYSRIVLLYLNQVRLAEYQYQLLTLACKDTHRDILARNKVHCELAYRNAERALSRRIEQVSGTSAERAAARAAAVHDYNAALEQASADRQAADLAANEQRTRELAELKASLDKVLTVLERELRRSLAELTRRREEALAQLQKTA